MKCDICGNKRAVIHIQQIAGNEEININICEKCAKEKGLTIDNSELGVSLKNMLNNFEDIKNAIEKRDNNRQCPVCSISFQDFKKKSRAGCSNCYRIFDRYVNSYLLKTTGFSEHKGKSPFKINIISKNRYRIDELRKKLGQAVSAENYEEAAYIRDKIKLMMRLIHRYGK